MNDSDASLINPVDRTNSISYKYELGVLFSSLDSAARLFSNLLRIILNYI